MNDFLKVYLPANLILLGQETMELQTCIKKRTLFFASMYSRCAHMPPSFLGQYDTLPCVLICTSFYITRIQICKLKKKWLPPVPFEFAWLYIYIECLRAPCSPVIVIVWVAVYPFSTHGNYHKFHCYFMLMLYFSCSLH